jgi:hypothetical protein
MSRTTSVSVAELGGGMTAEDESAFSGGSSVCGSEAMINLVCSLTSCVHQGGDDTTLGFE